MPWQYSEEYYREYTRTTWNESAEAYLDFMRNLEPFRAARIARLGPAIGENILDMGTGPGEPALTVATLVGPTGHVTGIDLSEKMIEIAKRIGASQSSGNTDFRVMDCSTLQFPDEAFDAIISSFGFQIFTNPEKAAQEARRVLTPSGRIALSVWSTGDQVPALHAIVGPMLVHAEPDETGYIPTPYETGGPGEMVAFLEKAGFQNCQETRVRHPMRFENEDGYLESILKGTPIGHSLSEEPQEVQREVLRETRKNLQAWKGPGGISIPAECVLVVGHR